MSNDAVPTGGSQPIIVKVSAGPGELTELFVRQAPGRKMRLGNCEFHVNRPVERCDWWVVCHASSLARAEETICDPAHVVLFSMEPYEFEPPGFYPQFARVFACDPAFAHAGRTSRNIISWWAGINVTFDHGHRFSPRINHDHDSLARLEPGVKQDRVSIITSNNKHFPGHLQRLKFIDQLLGSRIAQHLDFFGGGHNPVPDKLDALLPYKYHLALENRVLRNYWTEKLGDPLLGFALPFYHGCPNITDFFPPDALVPINLERPGEVVDAIEAALAEDAYARRQEPIRRARNLILNEYNVFQQMAELCLSPATQLRRIALKPPAAFVRRSLWTRAKGLSRRVLRKAGLLQ
jgi:hypothetical protein